MLLKIKWILFIIGAGAFGIFFYSAAIGYAGIAIGFAIAAAYGVVLHGAYTIGYYRAFAFSYLCAFAACGRKYCNEKYGLLHL